MRIWILIARDFRFRSIGGGVVVDNPARILGRLGEGIVGGFRLLRLLKLRLLKLERIRNYSRWLLL
jgi:hypothetical protein